VTCSKKLRSLTKVLKIRRNIEEPKKRKLSNNFLRRRILLVRIQELNPMKNSEKHNEKYY